jgi:hypothetical protein
MACQDRRLFWAPRGTHLPGKIASVCVSLSTFEKAVFLSSPSHTVRWKSLKSWDLQMGSANQNLCSFVLITAWLDIHSILFKLIFNSGMVLVGFSWASTPQSSNLTLSLYHLLSGRKTRAQSLDMELFLSSCIRVWGTSVAILPPPWDPEFIFFISCKGLDGLWVFSK